MPKLDGTVSGSYTNFLGSLSSEVPGVGVSQTTKSAAAGLTLTLPLFQGGRPSAQVRQARALTSQAIENYVAVERDVIAQTRGAYAAWRANEQIIAANHQAVGAQALSHEGAPPEHSLGTRPYPHQLSTNQEHINPT